MSKNLLVAVITFSFILYSFSGVDDDSANGDVLRRPFIPGREQNIF